MKNKIITITCCIIIIFSIILIVRSVILTVDNNLNNNLLKSDPLTVVQCDTKLIDLGLLSKDTIINHNYIFRNTGDNPLIIYHVNPDCNCTNYELSKKTASPGDSIILKLTIDTRGKHRFMINNIVRMNTKEEYYRLRIVGEVLEQIH